MNRREVLKGLAALPLLAVPFLPKFATGGVVTRGIDMGAGSMTAMTCWVPYDQAPPDWLGSRVSVQHMNGKRTLYEVTGVDVTIEGRGGELATVKKEWVLVACDLKEQT